MISAVASDVREHLPVRHPEWWAAFTMLFMGSWIEKPIDSFGLSPSYAFMAQMAPEHTWAIFFISLSGVRLLALLVNGTFRATRRWSPVVRSAAAGLSAATWALVCLMTWSANPGALITPLVGMVAIGEFGLCLFVARQGGADAQEGR